MATKLRVMHRGCNGTCEIASQSNVLDVTVLRQQNGKMFYMTENRRALTRFSY